MGIVKKVLMGLGVVCTLIIGLAIFLFSESAEFKERNEQFVRDFTKEFSREWDIASVSDLTSNDFLAQVATPNGQYALNQFRSYGRLVRIEDVEMGNYSAQAGIGVTGVLKFKAEFERVKALVTVTVLEKEGTVRIHGFHIEPLNQVSPQSEYNA